ncbi:MULTISPECIES: NADPH-dependent FMN reductase [Mesonia]|uniref:Chromate reductase n=1 Tax=Mesonia oceanica TaxID=2687242 RepID=A0AC61Y920_9FLAO|nr:MULTISPECIES: NAD(P)H-dependent oxidoreductase [Mesonia]MAN25851.1 NADPH-dependent FMN reductase [Mesonia sp.]MAN27529.1 NADPH-dependent FMN reductase [Mesonia sp.]MAQ40611.1 NADPH-dependent FMN reductase [Mesonia sp.]VVV01006.1 Chromate reductase [Mesonia oceanica]|tara:strand:- start:37992 stop:38534 length:543 start_codon:yes stop_codon:yes gene_type:complete
MKKILALAGSNSKNSINKKLLHYVIGRIENHEVKFLELTDYDFPMFGIDHEKERGFPADVQVVKVLIKEADALVIAVNEHNGGPSTYFKNLTDWLSRMELKFLEGKKVLLMSTSPGARGGASALAYYKDVLPRFGAEVVESFSLPSFNENFDTENNKITDEILLLGLNDVLSNFEQELQE